MSEDEKIQELIEKYGGYFENSNADVCHKVPVKLGDYIEEVLLYAREINMG